ncbi:MAG: TIGR03560 family F420-dependent LLM class oxidoreductase [Nitrososphaerales archaeon]
MAFKFGYQQPSHSFEGVENSFKKVAQIASECEEQGYDSFWLMDHLIQISRVGKITDPILEPYTALSGIASLTSQIKIGTLCTCNLFRNPALIAKMGATLDQVSDGRFWLGIGAGWFREEARMYGYEFPNAATRLGMLEESLKIIKRAWRNRKFTFHGKYYDFEDLVCEPKPIQRPRPQILVGGDGVKITLKLVAKYADACNLTQRGDELQRELDALKEHCKQVGRPYGSVMKTKLATVSFGGDVDAALKRSLAYKPRGMSQNEFWSSVLPGRPKDMIKEIEQFREQGIDYLIINFRGRYLAKDKLDFSQNVMSSF